ncbi:MAG: hypothetical protein WDO24_29945 [Pseudomonadota bacterium]
MISAINGVAVTDESNVVVHPGDAVTYQLEYQLTSGDFSNLALEAYLPPADLLGDRSDQSRRRDDSHQLRLYAGCRRRRREWHRRHLCRDASADSRHYALHTNGTGTVTVTSDSAVQPANSVTFNLGQQDSTSNSAATVDVYFTVTASSKPFAKDLFLTAQNQAGYSPAVSPNFAAQRHPDGTSRRAGSDDSEGRGLDRRRQRRQPATPPAA